MKNAHGRGPAFGRPRATKGISAASRHALSSSFLHELGGDLLTGLLEGSHEAGFGAGATVLREGQPPSAALMVSGRVRVYLTSPDGRQVTVRYAGVGDLLGTPIGAAPASLTARTLEESTVLVFDLAVLLSLAQRDSNVGWPMSEELNLQLSELLDQLALNAFGTLRQRVVESLVNMATSRGESPPLVAHVSQQELADGVGSVREAVARILRDLRQAGLIKTQPLAITLLKPRALRDEFWSRPAALPR